MAIVTLSGSDTGLPVLFRHIYPLPAGRNKRQRSPHSSRGNTSPSVYEKHLTACTSPESIKIINSLKDRSHAPCSPDLYPKKNGKLRLLGIQSSDDKLVQQVMKMILVSIYEDTFTDTSHSFRPNQSCQTALNQIKINFTGARCFIEGDIHSYFDIVDPHVSISILRRNIKNEAFISLIWIFLRAGHLENRRLHRPRRGLQQGSLISPIPRGVRHNIRGRHFRFQNFYSHTPRGVRPQQIVFLAISTPKYRVDLITLVYFPLLNAENANTDPHISGEPPTHLHVIAPSPD